MADLSAIFNTYPSYGTNVTLGTHKTSYTDKVSRKLHSELMKQAFPLSNCCDSNGTRAYVDNKIVQLYFAEGFENTVHTRDWFFL